MHANGNGQPHMSASGAARPDQYTVRLTAVKREPPVSVRAPVQVPRTDHAPVSPCARTPSPTYQVPPVPPTPLHAPAASTRPLIPRRAFNVGVLLRWMTVTMGALVLSTLAINAIDNLDNPADSLLGAAFRATTAPQGPCPEGMVSIDTPMGKTCIDMYEVSAGPDCVYRQPGSGTQTDANLATSGCVPVSVPNASPWVFISRQQAALACARAGKRLPFTNEWYRAALGTPDTDAVPAPDACNTEGNMSSNTGERATCVSPAGAYDMIGNVWEWQDETVTEGVLGGRTLPANGYVTSIDDSGVPLAVDEAMPSASLFSDYFAISPTDTQGVLRGGYWRSGTDAGVYGMNVTVPPSFQGNAVGFRCAKSAGK